jgi:hypothetical protein
MLLHEREHAEDAADAERAVPAVDGRTARPDGRARVGRPRQQRERGWRGPFRLIVGMDRMADDEFLDR